MSSPRRVPDTTVRRLSLYYRVLEKVLAEGDRRISSEELAELARSSSAQVRRDLSLFGSFGIRGRGYDAARLRERIGALLGLGRTWKTVVVGAGRLGTALASHREFERQGFEIVGLYDSDSAKIGVFAEGREVLDVATLADTMRTADVEIGVITTPASVAQDIASRLVQGGARGILNFAPTTLRVPPSVSVRHVNLAFELEGLSFAITEEAHGSDFHGGVREVDPGIEAA